VTSRLSPFSLITYPIGVYSFVASYPDPILFEPGKD
jgi:hypothetical protein